MYSEVLLPGRATTGRCGYRHGAADGSDALPLRAAGGVAAIAGQRRAAQSRNSAKHPAARALVTGCCKHRLQPLLELACSCTARRDGPGPRCRDVTGAGVGANPLGGAPVPHTLSNAGIVGRYAVLLES